MKNLILAIVLLLLSFLLHANCFGQSKKEKFKVLVLYENGGHHLPFTKAAKPWLEKLAADSSFTIDYIENTKTINEALLKQYKVFMQLDYPPYTWSEESMKAFQKYMNSGKGGWVGLHHATLLGEFDGYPMWQWFSDFMGGIKFVNYIPTFADAEVKIEDKSHPVFKGIKSDFLIQKEEWYIYDKSPRANVHVLASVDESTYKPDSEIKMGDHPVIWTNDHFASRNVYIFMGHSPELFNNEAYTTLLKNAIFWAAGKN
ncbi:ThuA domain-containing protein [Flavobacterium daemonense]|uniref:ThuA domain-containing protein n=1 Tax=Flavobacterium daemonense TaxID=1393049 RepID=UPI0011855B50|nr:ThuA domain-containing protein [Flavobacterium daemonense]KAF2328609.1 ThuA domain-containing protein [Flavobacterium daemonense]